MLNKTKLLTYTLSIAFILAIVGMTTLHAGHHGGKNKMKMMDTDGDGAVSKEEFMSHKEQRFMKKDENGDGVLTEDEMKKNCKHKNKGKSEKE
ncbi:MAG: hypothetical protein AAF304_07350 [Pseudomonadota bacterium]